MHRNSISIPVHEGLPALPRRVVLAAMLGGLGSIAAPQWAQAGTSLPPSSRGGIGAQRTVIGAVKPDASNTGVRTGVTLRPVNGDYTASTPGAVVSGLDIAGFVRVTAHNVTIRNCRIKGRGRSYVQSALISVAPGITGTTIEYCDIFAATTIGYWQNGVGGYGYTARFCDVHDVVDGFSVSNPGGATIEANYIHDLSFFSNDADQANDPVHPYWSHNDGVQVKGGSGNIIRGNFFRTFASTVTGTLDRPRSNYGAGITLSPYQAPIRGQLITQNWFTGGDVGLQANGYYPGQTSGNLGEISENRFGKNQFTGYQIRHKTGCTVARELTNYFDPNDASVPASLRGVTFTTAAGGGIKLDR